MRIMGFVGWSGSGKTTLLAGLIPTLIAAGHSVSTIKHAHHEFDIDRPGKDSHTHRAAGATEVLISSGRRWALMHELRGAGEPSLNDLLTHLAGVDLVLIEGFKREHYPKIEVYRPSASKPLLQPDDPWIVGVAADAPLTLTVPVLWLDDIEAIAGFVWRHAMEVSPMPRDSADRDNRSPAPLPTPDPEPRN